MEAGTLAQDLTLIEGEYFPTELAEILPEKNKENVWVPEEIDDFSTERKYCQFKTGGWCPFPETCSKKAWKNAKCVSFVSRQKCFQYLMQHGLESSNHYYAAQECFDKIIELVCDEERPLTIEVITEKPQDRQQYRDQVKAAQSHWEDADEEEKPKKKKWKPTKKEPHSDIGPSDSVSSASRAKNDSADPDASMVISMAVQEGIRMALGQSRQAIGNVDWGSIVNPNAAQSLTLTTPGETAEVPIEKLKLIQDALQRAENAIGFSLQATVGACQKLNGERLIVQNAINQISVLTGQKPTHVG
jgi:hypothetical protein